MRPTDIPPDQWMALHLSQRLMLNLPFAVMSLIGLVALAAGGYLAFMQKAKEADNYRAQVILLEKELGSAIDDRREKEEVIGEILTQYKSLHERLGAVELAKRYSSEGLKSQAIIEKIRETPQLQQTEQMQQMQRQPDVVPSETTPSETMQAPEIAPTPVETMPAEQPEQGSIDLSLINVAYAQDPLSDGGLLDNGGQNSWILPFILIFLGIVYVIALGKTFFSSNTQNVELAIDLVKTLTGFFIGVVTSLVA